MAGDFSVGEVVGVVLDLGVEVAIKDIKRQFGGIDTDLAEAVEDFGTTTVLCICDRFEVLPPVVRSDAVLAVNTGFVERPYPGEIHRMRNENILVVIPRMPKCQVPLFALGIHLVFTILGRSELAFHYRLLTIGCDTQTDGAVAGHIEAIPVVGFVWHKVQESALVHDF